MPCGPRFKYLGFSRLLASSTEFGERGVLVSLSPPPTSPGGGWPYLCAMVGTPIALTVEASFHNLVLRDGVLGVQ